MPAFGGCSSVGECCPRTLLASAAGARCRRMLSANDVGSTGLWLSNVGAVVPALSPPIPVIVLDVLLNFISAAAMGDHPQAYGLPPHSNVLTGYLRIPMCGLWPGELYVRGGKPSWLRAGTLCWMRTFGLCVPELCARTYSAQVHRHICRPGVSVLTK